MLLFHDFLRYIIKEKYYEKVLIKKRFYEWKNKSRKIKFGMLLNSESGYFTWNEYIISQYKILKKFLAKNICIRKK